MQSSPRIRRAIPVFIADVHTPRLKYPRKYAQLPSGTYEQFNAVLIEDEGGRIYLVPVVMIMTNRNPRENYTIATPEDRVTSWFSTDLGQHEFLQKSPFFVVTDGYYPRIRRSFKGGVDGFHALWTQAKYVFTGVNVTENSRWKSFTAKYWPGIAAWTRVDDAVDWVLDRAPPIRIKKADTNAILKPWSSISLLSIDFESPSLSSSIIGDSSDQYDINDDLDDVENQDEDENEDELKTNKSKAKLKLSPEQRRQRNEFTLAENNLTEADVLANIQQKIKVGSILPDGTCPGFRDINGFLRLCPLSTKIDLETVRLGVHPAPNGKLYLAVPTRCNTCKCRNEAMRKNYYHSVLIDGMNVCRECLRPAALEGEGRYCLDHIPQLEANSIQRRAINDLLQAGLTLDIPGLDHFLQTAYAGDASKIVTIDTEWRWLRDDEGATDFAYPIIREVALIDWNGHCLFSFDAAVQGGTSIDEPLSQAQVEILRNGLRAHIKKDTILLEWSTSNCDASIIEPFFRNEAGLLEDFPSSTIDSTERRFRLFHAYRATFGTHMPNYRLTTVVDAILPKNDKGRKWIPHAHRAVMDAKMAWKIAKIFANSCRRDTKE